MYGPRPELWNQKGVGIVSRAGRLRHRDGHGSAGHEGKYSTCDQSQVFTHDMAAQTTALK
jgi:hypothetical protein